MTESNNLRQDIEALSAERDALEKEVEALKAKRDDLFEGVRDAEQMKSVAWDSFYALADHLKAILIRIACFILLDDDLADFVFFIHVRCVIPTFESEMFAIFCFKNSDRCVVETTSLTEQTWLKSQKATNRSC